jgi:hypothetical protein
VRATRDVVVDDVRAMTEETMTMMTIRTARPRMGGGRRSRRDANAIGRAREGVVTTRASRMREIKYVSSDAVEVENARGVSRAVGACA